jgi:putative hydrolase of the HAD superfamily
MPGGRASRSRDPSLVLFDLGGVVCRFVPERRLQLLASAAGKPPEEVHELLWGSGFSRRCDRGEFRGAEMHERACELLGWAASYDDFRRTWASAFEPDPDVLALVDAVRRDHATGLLTDNPPVLEDALRHELREVGLRFDFRFLSFELHSAKPAPAVFHAALHRARRRPGEVLFIDDSRENVEAAALLGISALRFTSARALEADLVRLRVMSGGCPVPPSRAG